MRQGDVSSALDGQAGPEVLLLPSFLALAMSPLHVHLVFLFLRTSHRWDRQRLERSSKLGIPSTRSSLPFPSSGLAPQTPCTLPIHVTLLKHPTLQNQLSVLEFDSILTQLCRSHNPLDCAPPHTSDVSFKSRVSLSQLHFCRCDYTVVGSHQLPLGLVIC